jgi:AraC family transcriptional regulator
MEQPPLDHHYIVQHLGGDKVVRRRGDGAAMSALVPRGAVTIVPAGSAYRWQTDGPIAFTHIYLSVGCIIATASRLQCNVDISLVDRVGLRDPGLEALYTEMTASLSGPQLPPTLYLDSLLECFLLKLLSGYATSKLPLPRGKETIPRFQFVRVIDYIEANLGKTLSLIDLANVAKSSVFHFSRAFRNTAGSTPYQYVLWRRVTRATELLTKTDSPLWEIAAVCGFRDATHLSRTFVRLTGASPKSIRGR